MTFIAQYIACENEMQYIFYSIEWSNSGAITNEMCFGGRYNCKVV